MRRKRATTAIFLTKTHQLEYNPKETLDKSEGHSTKQLGYHLLMSRSLNSRKD